MDDFDEDDDGDEELKLLQSIQCQIQSTAPRCLDGFKLVQASNPTERDDLVTTWSIACECGCQHGRVLGHTLKEFNRSYDGPLEFVRPIEFECVGCGQTKLVIDNHGYSNEVAKIEGGIGSATYRGSGEPAAFCCHHCQSSEFEVTTSFMYSPGAFDLFLDEPELPATDFFDVFEARGLCTNCGKTSLIASFEG